MPVLPSVLMLGFGTLVWLLRRRPERVVWAVSVTGQWVVWFVILGIHRFVPTELRFSVWRPVELFQTPLVLTLDTTGWTMAFVIATALLAIGLTSAARGGSANPATRVFISVYGALGMAAVVAGNLLTMAVLWAMMEVVAFSTSLILVGRRDVIPREILRLAVQGTSVVFLLASAVLLGPTAASPAVETATWGFALGFAAAIVRWGLIPAHFPLPALPGIRRGLGTCLRLLPFAMGMVLVIRLLEIQPPVFILQSLSWVGGILALSGGLVWAFHSDPVQRRPMLLMGVAGLAVCSAGLSTSPSSASIALGGSASLVMLGAMISLAEGHEPWHKWWVLPAAYMLLGGPLMPSQFLPQALVGPALTAAGSAGLLGAVLLAVGVVRLSRSEPTPWPSGEELVKLSYVVGIAILPVAGVGISVSNSENPSVRTVAVFLALVGLCALAYYGYRRTQHALRTWIDSRASAFDPPALSADIPAFLTSPLRGLVWVGDLLQGDAGLLWIMFLLMVLAAIVGRGP